MTGTPPIPARLAEHPLIGGLVAPYITLHTDKGHAFGQISNTRWREVITGYRCQTCGNRLGNRYILLVRPTDIKQGYTAEPAMHPECAHYSKQACPMVAGRMSRYRTNPHPGTACADPDCRCELIPTDADHTIRSGAPAEPWLAAWCARDQYTAAVSDHGELAGVSIPAEPLRLRPVLPANLRAAIELLETL